MKRLPISAGLMIFGLMWVSLGAANGWVVAQSFGGAEIIGGFIWFCVMWDKLYIDLRKIRSYEKRLRRGEEAAKDQAAYRELKDKEIDHQLKALRKQNSQNIKGQVTYIHRKEA